MPAAPARSSSEMAPAPQGPIPAIALLDTTNPAFCPREKRVFPPDNDSRSSDDSDPEDYSTDSRYDVFA